jgi:L-arabinose transport system substrate-binding protein
LTPGTVTGSKIGIQVNLTNWNEYPIILVITPILIGEKRGIISKVQKFTKFGIHAILLGSLILSGCQKSRELASTEKEANFNKTGMMTGLKVAMVVPSLNDPWVELLTQYGKQAATDSGATLIIEEFSEKNPERVAEHMGGLVAQGVKGLVLQTTADTLGATIRDNAESYGVKTIALNLRLREESTGKLLDVPFFGIEQRDLGNVASQYIISEAETRKWDLSKVGVILSQSAASEAERARLGALKTALLASGVRESNLRVVERGGSISSAQSASAAFLSNRKDLTNWIIAGSVDEGVIGGVRATEATGLSASNVLGIGIGGLSAIEELEKPENGFFGSLLISPKELGYDAIIRVLQAVSENTDLDTAPEYKNGSLMTRANLDAMKKENKLDLIATLNSKVRSSQQGTANLKVTLQKRGDLASDVPNAPTIESNAVGEPTPGTAPEQAPVKIDNAPSSGSVTSGR